DGDFAVVQRQGDALDAGAVGLADLVRGAAEHPGAVDHVLDVAAGGKRGPGAGEDHRADVDVGVDAVDVGDDRVDDFGRGDRVADLRQVDGPRLHVPVAVDEQHVLGHCSSMLHVG